MPRTRAGLAVVSRSNLFKGGRYLCESAPPNDPADLGNINGL